MIKKYIYILGKGETLLDSPPPLPLQKKYNIWMDFLEGIFSGQEKLWTLGRKGRLCD